jgi:hypothetical protein
MFPPFWIDVNAKGGSRCLLAAPNITIDGGAREALSYDAERVAGQLGR